MTAYLVSLLAEIDARSEQDARMLAQRLYDMVDTPNFVTALRGDVVAEGELLEPSE